MSVEALKFIRYSSVGSFDLKLIVVYCELFMWIIYVNYLCGQTHWREICYSGNARYCGIIPPVKLKLRVQRHGQTKLSSALMSGEGW